MEKLKVKFRRIDETVFMKVIQQDESTRGGELKYQLNGFRIISRGYPAIDDGTSLLIRGVNKEEDYRIARIVFHNNRNAKEYIKKAKACIKAYNESLGEKEEVVEKEDGIYIPEKNDIYYFVRESVMRGLTCGRASFCNDDTDKTRLLTNNVFKTESEAERAVEIEKKKMELSKVFSKEEWKKLGIHKYYIRYDILDEIEIIDTSHITVDEVTYFETEEKAQEFFDFCGSDDYRKYVLGVY